MTFPRICVLLSLSSEDSKNVFGRFSSTSCSQMRIFPFDCDSYYEQLGLTQYYLSMFFIGLRIETPNNGHPK